MEITIFILLLAIVFLLAKIKSLKAVSHKKIFTTKDALLNSSQLIKHAEELGKLHRASDKGKNYSFLKEGLKYNYDYITKVYSYIIEVGKKGIPRVSPGEWLLDNYYIIEEQIKELYKSIDKGFLKKLPYIEGEVFSDYPRILVLMMEYVSHTDGKLSKDGFLNFINAYQSQSPLTMAELWALAPMLRLALFEKTRRLCKRMLHIQRCWENAESMLGNSDNLVFFKAIKQISESKEIELHYIQHLLSILKRQDMDGEEILGTIKKELSHFNITLDGAVDEAHKRELSLQNSIGNCITSLRLISTLDWKDIFEDLSTVEKILRQDPSGYYSLQDFETRDYYRRKTEAISRHINLSQKSTAHKILQLAKESYEKGSSPIETHVGYYILSHGRSRLLSKPEKTHESFGVYLAPIISSTLIGGLLCFLYALVMSNGNISISTAAALSALIPISEISIQIVNYIITKVVPPSILPRLECSNGIDENAKTIVIVPTILPSKERVIELLKHLEVTYIANKEKNIYFAILGDLKDYNEENMIKDKEILNCGIDIVKKLNYKYSSKEDIFYFLSRKRTYSKTQGRWMGLERKRGAIMEFNKLIRGYKDTTYSVISSDIACLMSAKYIITLDADTILPIGAAKKLIGTISHPLNHPVIDSKMGLVREGYGLIQPRIGIDIESTNRSLFSSIFGGKGGIDTYTTAVSDVYQDLFGEGIFTGKGIYEIDTFLTILDKAIPQNRILSHDLLEGSYIRAGLAQDIELIDGYPGKYISYILRLHRWIRGDWQLIKWLFPLVENSEGKSVKNPLSSLSRWKIFDNLRRSLLYPSLLILIFIGLFILPSSFFWLGIALLTLAFPVFIGFFNLCLSLFYIRDNKKSGVGIGEVIKIPFYQAMILLILLPFNSFMVLDAAIRTLFRVFISKKNLLEWVTAAEVERKAKDGLASYINRMYISPILGILIILLTFNFNKAYLIASVILGLTWILSPYAAYYLSINKMPYREQISYEDELILRRIARKTWAFYEDMAGKDDNYLPPDNYQELPIKRTAHRTSPTNIGFLLLSTLSARYLGYISTEEMLLRLENSLKTIEKLKKWKGHLYNWYDTKTLEVLNPKYVSTVDSANFISYLMTLSGILKSFTNAPILDCNILKGLIDTLNIYKLPIKKYLNNPNNSIYELYNTLIMLKEDLIEENNYKEEVKEHIEDFIEEIEFLIPQAFLKKQSNLKNALSYASLSSLKDFYENILLDRESLNSSLINEAENKLKNIDCYIKRIKLLIEVAEKIAASASFTSLFDNASGLFSIGFNEEENKLTSSYYDLFASEARIAYYIAASKGEIDVKSWFRLGRSLTRIGNKRCLVSWTGTMFEYLMPPLIMKSYPKTLLDETYNSAIYAQILYGKLRKLPWGISESGYNTFDFQLNYQYKAFGVPDIGLKRGLIKDIVVSPYSTLLALPYSPNEGIKNLKRLIKLGLEGSYGLYEALDFTPGRLEKEESFAIVKSFMAHHQGMILLSIVNYLMDWMMVKGFHNNPYIKAGELMLQERIPEKSIITKELKERPEPIKGYIERIKWPERRMGAFDSMLPKCCLLSNGSYSIMVDNRGCGYSRYNDLAITRWREDSIKAASGMFIFVKNTTTNEVWSTAYGPVNKQPDSYNVTMSQDRAEFLRIDGDIKTRTLICVSPEDNCEIRKVTIKNNGKNSSAFEITSYFEVVMASQAEDEAHPAFSNLFVTTKAQNKTLIANRRARKADKEGSFTYHTLCIGEDTSVNFEYETDRFKFIGRGRDLSNPAAMENPLSNTTGSVLEPVMSIRKKLEIPSGGSITLSFITGFSASKEGAIIASDKYKDQNMVDRAFELAYLRSRMEVEYLSLTQKDVKLFDDMISHIIYNSPIRLKYSDVIEKNIKGQSSLWPYGISGDIPIVLVRIKDEKDIDRVKLLLKAHQYWKVKGLRVDLVILNEFEGSYFHQLEDTIKSTLSGSLGMDIQDKTGGIFIRNACQMPIEDRVLLYSGARIIIDAGGGNINSQISINEYPVVISNKKFKLLSESCINPIDINKLKYFNGYGGFDTEKNEYVIILENGITTPLPWINVISNPSFGFIITEKGSGYTWSENSRENKLTPWSNDPVSDPCGEAIFIKDVESGSFWSPTPEPANLKGCFSVHHGQGYTTFKNSTQGIYNELTLFTPLKDNIKISLLKIRNKLPKPRRLSLYYYIRPVMGVSEGTTQRHIITNFDEKLNTFTSKNSYNTEFPGRYAYLWSREKIVSFTGDRREFIGFYGGLNNPLSLYSNCLSGRTGIGLDPCCAIQIDIELSPMGDMEIPFIFGESKSLDEIKYLLNRYNDLEDIKSAFNIVKEYWKNTLEAIKVKTPDTSMNIMLNPWLLYQNISCRLWARSGFYQSGGAYGFRDQLQDILSIINIMPEIAKNQIILHAKHQFIEGDVLHWWHPGIKDRGIRTRFSDDLLWLAYATCEYIEKTEDYSILDEIVPYIKSTPLGENEDERYEIPKIAEEKESIYKHCIRAIEKSLNTGKHGISLMGSGDWNDGMNTVGNKGMGESVWLGWFLYNILKRFIPICSYKKDDKKAYAFNSEADKILENIQLNAWDGQWYIRAFFDDGTPLGSSTNNECRIDSIAQSWAVISGGECDKRAYTSLESLEKYLVRHEDGLILLFTPPFDKSKLEPGYIKGYVPGVRENGGQYTHAAAWVIYAYALMGMGDKAHYLFNMINPINHTSTSMECHRYKAEPYVIAADVYTVDPHKGRGGWTWYTGSAGWIYKAALEGILGFNKKGSKLVINPSIPKVWGEYTIEYRYGKTYYTIHVKNPKGVSHGVRNILFDSVPQNSDGITLKDDGLNHYIEVILG